MEVSQHVVTLPEKIHGQHRLIALLLCFIAMTECDFANELDKVDFSNVSSENVDARLSSILEYARTAPAQEKGHIYATIAIQLGSRDPDKLYDRILEMADLALACDLSALDRVLVGGVKGTAIRCRHSAAKDSELKKWRLEATKAFLTGTKAALDSKKTLEKENPNFNPDEWVPVIGNYTPDAEYLRKEKLFQQFLDINETCRTAVGLTGNIVDMYARPPYDFPELTKVLDSFLGECDLKNDILSKTHKSVEARINRSKQTTVRHFVDELPLGGSPIFATPPKRFTYVDNSSSGIKTATSVNTNIKRTKHYLFGFFGAAIAVALTTGIYYKRKWVRQPGNK